MVRLVALILLGILVGCGSIVSAPATKLTATPQPAVRVASTRTTQSAEPVLELAKGGGCETTGTGRNIQYSGKVKNISDRPLHRVRFIVTYTAQDGTFVKTDSSPIDFDPLLPGQSSPFTTITSTNPSITNCAVEFQEGLGGPKLIAVRQE